MIRGILAFVFVLILVAGAYVFGTMSSNTQTTSVTPPETPESVIDTPQNPPTTIAIEPTAEPTAAPLNENQTTSLSEITKSIVMVEALDYYGIPAGYGSGTVIDERGFILTAFHVVGNPKTGEYDNPDRVVKIYTNASFTDEPEFKYYAQVIDANPAADLAVLRIILLKSGEVPADCLNSNFTAMPVSTIIPDVGDEIQILGFPASGSTTLTLSNTRVAGYVNYDTYDPRTTGKYRAIKLDSSIGSGASGGAIINSDKQLVGVPIFKLNDGNTNDMGYAAMFASAEQLIKDAINNPVPGCNGAAEAKLQIHPRDYSETYFEGFVYNPNTGSYLEGVRVLVFEPSVKVGGITAEDIKNNWGEAFTNKDGYFRIPFQDWAYDTNFVVSFNYNGRVYMQEYSNTLFDQYLYDDDKFNGLFVPLDIK
jgi:S1-C subfamily serine protease